MKRSEVIKWSTEEEVITVSQCPDSCCSPLSIHETQLPEGRPAGCVLKHVLADTWVVPLKHGETATGVVHLRLLVEWDERQYDKKRERREDERVEWRMKEKKKRGRGVLISQYSKTRWTSLRYTARTANSWEHWPVHYVHFIAQVTLLDDSLPCTHLAHSHDLLKWKRRGPAWRSESKSKRGDKGERGS